jgi:hypothetical protein
MASGGETYLLHRSHAQLASAPDGLFIRRRRVKFMCSWNVESGVLPKNVEGEPYSRQLLRASESGEQTENRPRIYCGEWLEPMTIKPLQFAL